MRLWAALHSIPWQQLGLQEKEKPSQESGFCRFPSFSVVPYFGGRAMDNCFALNRYVKPQDLFQVERTVKPNRRG